MKQVKITEGLLTVMGAEQVLQKIGGREVLTYRWKFGTREEPLGEFWVYESGQYWITNKMWEVQTVADLLTAIHEYGKQAGRDAKVAEIRNALNIPD